MNFSLSLISHATPIILAAIALSACSRLPPDVWWQVHTECPTTTYWDLDWSPDGSRLAYAADIESLGHDTVNIFIMDVENGRISQLTRIRDGRAVTPVWLPDGTRIAYTGFMRRNISDIVAHEPYMAMLNTDGNRPKAIGFNTYSAPSWSPDGTHLVTSDLQNDSNIIVIDLKTLIPQEVKGLSGEDPDWSSDGRQIVFTQAEQGGDIYTANIDGTHVLRVIDADGNANPSWSPDSSMILFTHGDQQKSEPDINVFDFTTSSIMTITQGINPSWSPDGNQIAFISDRTGHTEIYTINVDGTSLTQLTHNPSNEICLH